MNTASITGLLNAWREGDQVARDAVMNAVYGQLRALAAQCLASEGPGHTLQPTAIVHEAYLRLVNVEVTWEDRLHFFRLATRMMRRILVDHARTKQRVKRGGAALLLSMDDVLIFPATDPLPVLELDAALDRLAAFDARKCEMVELFYYAGLTQEDIARAFDLAPMTVFRELKLARAWLNTQLNDPFQAPE